MVTRASSKVHQFHRHINSSAAPSCVNIRWTSQDSEDRRQGPRPLDLEHMTNDVAASHLQGWAQTLLLSTRPLSDSTFPSKRLQTLVPVRTTRTETTQWLGIYRRSWCRETECLEQQPCGLPPRSPPLHICSLAATRHQAQAPTKLRKTSKQLHQKRASKRPQPTSRLRPTASPSQHLQTLQSQRRCQSTRCHLLVPTRLQTSGTRRRRWRCAGARHSSLQHPVSQAGHKWRAQQPRPLVLGPTTPRMGRSLPTIAAASSPTPTALAPPRQWHRDLALTTRTTHQVQCSRGLSTLLSMESTFKLLRMPLQCWKRNLGMPLGVVVGRILEGVVDQVNRAMSFRYYISWTKIRRGFMCRIASASVGLLVSIM
mmetsp:Transcript_36326/g.43932  ORF Transcript_36326/g.43932 Transcript_36326/m.43932 type:complete len:370 (+) Transcript_36326:1075-2184(+)